MEYARKHPLGRISGTILGRRIKLKNRRVDLGTFSDGTYAVEFKNLIKDAPKGERVRVTHFAASKEGLDALFSLYVSLRGCPLLPPQKGPEEKEPSDA